MSWNATTDGQKRRVVPRLVLASTWASGLTAAPSAYSWWKWKPLWKMSRVSFCDSALTTLTPTPCRPPETL
ncbi:hypothetical protein D9M71_668380 [compost metagenome]